MTWYNLIFFHVFKRCYKNGNYKNDIPWLTASVIVGMSSLFYLYSLTALLFFVVNGEVLEFNKIIFVSIGFVFITLNWLWFTGCNRFLKIFKNFKEKYLEDKLSDTLSWTYVFGAYVVFIVMIVFLRL